MQIMNSKMYYSPIIFLLTGFLLSSCQENLSIPEGTKENISVSFSATSASSPHIGSAGKDPINTLHILVFDGVSSELGYACLDYTVKATPQQEGTFAVTFTKSQDARLVVLANADDSKIAQLSEAMNYSTVSGVLLGNAGQRYSVEAPVPMFGVVNRGDVVKIEKGMSLGTIKLIRAVARIDIGVGTYNPETGQWDLPSGSGKYFELTDIEAWSPMGRNFYMPAWRVEGNSNLSFDEEKTPSVQRASGDLDNSQTTAVQWKYTDTDIRTNGNATFCYDVIYLPEAALRGYTANQAVNRNKRTTLIIGGLLHDPANLTESEVKTWYRVDFTEETSNAPNGALFDILRNHLYRFSLNVQKRGASSAQEAWNVHLSPEQVLMEVAPWKDNVVDIPHEPDISIDYANCDFPEGVQLGTSPMMMNVSNKGAEEIVLAFRADFPVELTAIVNPQPQRLTIVENGTIETAGKIVTRFKITVKEQTIGQLGYQVTFKIKSPFQQLGYNPVTIKVAASDVWLPTVTLGGRTWMAFNTNGKGNDCQLYLKPEATVEDMYRLHWERTLGYQFQYGANKAHVPWETPNSPQGGLGPSWNGKPAGAPCPEGYRVPEVDELRALLPAGHSLSLGSSLTYDYNGESITASLKQGTPANVTFPESAITADTYYITLSSNVTNAVMYIPFGGWKPDTNPGANPNNQNGVCLWNNKLGYALQIKKQDGLMSWRASHSLLGQNSYAYVRCIQK